MSVTKVDHVNVVTEDIEATRVFYCDVLGLVEGPRPGFRVRGLWLYAGNRAVMHLQVPEGSAVGPSQKGALRHFAFEVSDFDAMIARLDARGVAYKLAQPPGSDIRQAFLLDPNEVIVELIYYPA